VSYDVWYEVEVNGEWVQASSDWNYTSNMSRMWREAGCDIADFDHRPVTEFAQPLADAIARIEADLPRFRAMNAPNGWGDADGCLEHFLKPLLRDAQVVHQQARVVVSR
jgi:hypothetical protein